MRYPLQRCPPLCLVQPPGGFGSHLYPAPLRAARQGSWGVGLTASRGAARYSRVATPSPLRVYYTTHDLICLLVKCTNLGFFYAETLLVLLLDTRLVVWYNETSARVGGARAAEGLCIFEVKK